MRRTGIAPEEASAVAATLSNAMDVNAMRAGQRFETAISQPRGGRGDARLIGLTMRTGPATQLTVSRSFDGALRLRALEEKVTHETVVLTGKVEGSLSRTARREGAPAAVARAAGRLFSHKFDMERDIRANDEFTYVFGRTVTENGRTIETGELLYAELKGVAFYRFQAGGSPRGPVFRRHRQEHALGHDAHAAGAGLPHLLDRSASAATRSPAIARCTRASTSPPARGTPVVAPADGVVVEARRWGGYGNWLRIRHSNGLESGYGHLSRYGSGIRAGQRVRQGQIVAYVGSTGASTGPHLHYEIWRSGQRINPAGVRTTEGTVLAGCRSGGVPR